jgi:hypothetical protein
VHFAPDLQNMNEHRTGLLVIPFTCFTGKTMHEPDEIWNERYTIGGNQARIFFISYDRQ